MEPNLELYELQNEYHGLLNTIRRDYIDILSFTDSYSIDDTVFFKNEKSEYDFYITIQQVMAITRRKIEINKSETGFPGLIDFKPMNLEISKLNENNFKIINDILKTISKKLISVKLKYYEDYNKEPYDVLKNIQSNLNARYLYKEE